ncbi:hypothetical protein KP509_28G061500 [Ceratopteris richardii]|nr:hypothetical protein KP509_28G061500 [Ceratopteris richardii]
MKVDLGMENVHSLKVDTLSYEESRKLMLQLTRGNASQAAHLSDVLELCQGLPLALRLVARYVRMQCILGNVDADVKTIWEKIAGIMRECKPFPGADVDIYMHLRFGINILPDVEDRRAFLDIVFMMKMDRALLYPRLGWIDWKTVEEFVGERHVEVLSSAGLVEKHWQYRYGEWRWIPKVHDVLLQIGGQMGREGGHGIRIVGEDELSQISRASWPEVVALCDVEIEAVHLSQMPRLRYLFHVRICSTSLPGLELNDLVAVRGSNDTHFVTLPKVVYFRWKMNNSAASLEFLRKSRGLRQVILIDWSNLQNVDAIESLTALQRLNFESCNSITTLPSGISGLTSLTDLSFTSSQNSFNSLQDIPRGISSLRKLKVLNLCACTRIEALPEEIGQLTALETIKLSRCSNLSTLPEGISYLTGLKHLDLGACVGLTTLPHGLARLTALENLNLTGSKLETIPNGISHLTALRNLKLSGCQALTCLPEGISSLTRLEILDLWSCDRLQTLPNGISKLTALTTLILWRCSNLRTLPAGITSMVGLRELDLRYCSNLESLPPGISALTASEDISLEGCYEGIPLSESFKPGSSKKTRLSAGLISFLFRQRTHASKRAFTDTFRTLLTSMGISVSQKEDRPMASAPPNL